MIEVIYPWLIVMFSVILSNLFISLLYNKWRNDRVWLTTSEVNNAMVGNALLLVLWVVGLLVLLIPLVGASAYLMTVLSSYMGDSGSVAASTAMLSAFLGFFMGSLAIGSLLFGKMVLRYFLKKTNVGK